MLNCYNYFLFTMLSHLGIAAAQHGTHHAHNMKGVKKEWNDPLNAGDTAEFAAGMLYALSG